jgi:hypothetical protein
VGGHPPEKARKILADAGYSLDAVLQGWIDAGYLEQSGTQRPKHLIQKKIPGAQAKYLVVFTSKGLDYTPYTGTGSPKPVRARG